jgi:hypothetical protein
MTHPAPYTGGAWLLGGGAALLLFVAGNAALQLRVVSEPTLLVAGLILALALAPLLARVVVARDGSTVPLLGASLAIVLVYAAAHWVTGFVVAPVVGVASTALIGAGFVAVAFLTLFVVQAVVLTQPSGRFARALYPACFAGFYLDEIFTRLTFQIWPPTPPIPSLRTRDALATEAAADRSSQGVHLAVQTGVAPHGRHRHRHRHRRPGHDVWRFDGRLPHRGAGIGQ